MGGEEQGAEGVADALEELGFQREGDGEGEDVGDGGREG